MKSSSPLTQLPVYARVLVGLAYLAAIVMLGVFVVLRMRGKDGNAAKIVRSSWPRACLALFFVSSWLFVLSSAISSIVSSYTTSWALCLYAQYTCILLYAIAKVFIYLFLIEKVHVVWISLNTQGRLKSPVYLLCLASMVFYPFYMVGLVGFKGYTARIRADGRCDIGLKHFISLPIIAYDLYLNILLTTLFVLPLWRRNLTNVVIRRIAQRSLVATVVSLTASTLNILFIFICHGLQPMWVCLGSCCLDITICAVAMFWTTSVRETTGTADVATPPSAIVFAPQPPAAIDLRRDTMSSIDDQEGCGDGKSVLDAQKDTVSNDSEDEDRTLKPVGLV